MNTKDKILEVAYSLFHRFGIRSVSMDDIAKEVAVSKKTIYQHFADKDEIVHEVTVQAVAEDKANFSKVHELSQSAIHEMVMLSTCISENTREINPSLLYDLQKYHPKSWVLWEEYKNDFIKNMVLSGITKGKKEGVFRQDINDELLAIFRIESIEMTFDPGIFSSEKFDFVEVYLELFKHFVYGMLTPKGHEEFENLIKTI